MEYSILEEQIDGESNWYYYKNKDYLWDIIKNDWLSCCKEKYLKYIDNNETIITCGAHIGMYTRFYAKNFKKVYAFEPDPFHFFCLTNNVPDENVIKIQAAVGNERKMIELYQSGCNGHLTLSVNQDTNSGMVPTLMVDDLNIKDCSLLQLDVENYEYKVLLGSIKTIESSYPVIIAENGDTEDIKNFLSPMGYKIIDRTSYDTIWKK